MVKGSAAKPGRRQKESRGIMLHDGKGQLQRNTTKGLENCVALKCSQTRGIGDIE